MKKEIQGFTLVELLVVIAIVGILAGLLVPLAGRGSDSAKKKKAAMEANNLTVAVERYHDDHHFMPCTDSKKLGSDLWVSTDDKEWLAVIQGDNALKQNYLTIKMTDAGTFLDPWGNPYQVGMDRDLDGRVNAKSGGKVAHQPVVVLSNGPDGASGTDDDISTCEWQ